MKEIKTESCNYPTKKILLAYSLLGGVLGGLLLSIVALPFTDKFIDIYDFLHWILIFTISGSVYGFPPALFTGILVVCKRKYLCSYRDYVWLFCNGIFMSFLCLCFLLLFGMEVMRIYVIGGMSAVIVGHFVIPKKKLRV